MAYNIYSNLSDFWTSDDDEESNEEEEENNVKNDKEEDNNIKNERYVYDIEDSFNEYNFDKREDMSMMYMDDNSFNKSIDKGLNFNIQDILNDCSNDISENFTINNLLEKYDINNFVYNDNLLKYCETGVAINDEKPNNEKLNLNEGFEFNVKSSFNYINPPSYNLKMNRDIKNEVQHENIKNNNIEMNQVINNEDDMLINKKVLDDNENVDMENADYPNGKNIYNNNDNNNNDDNNNNNDNINYDGGNNSNEPQRLNNHIENTKIKYIRKKWVIEDNESDISNFNKNDLLLNYDFELDDFQKRSIKHLNNFKHVFVAAHTSAGKTLIAEHAIALSIKLQKKAIYTSPIKALSNQKYYEFKNIFKDVGIITGDVKMNVNANCIIMTTEILRNLLYLNDNIINNIHCVIFDEVHYVNDEDRGVIWEESIIMLPHHVQILLLSATVPNYLEFADWVGFTKQKEVISIATKKRPVPLLHYIYAYDSVYLVMDEKNKFYSSAFKEIYVKIREKQEANNKNTKQLTSGANNTSSNFKKNNNYYDSKNKNANTTNNKENDNIQNNSNNNNNNNTNNNVKGYYEYCKQKRKQKLFANEASMKTEIQKLQTLIKKLDQDNKLPVVLFCFSRIKCETYAKCMPHLNFLDTNKKSKVHLFIKESISKLPKQDRELNQIQSLSKLLEKGIGVHHSGLLPILKEIVEILFSKGLIKVLYATETFAMGINMPTKSVVFTSIYKHDHLRKRILTSSEYTQMSGRAGRRSSDKYGYVYICCCDNIPDQVQLTEMMMQKAVSLKSKFKVTYNMILKLLINKQINIEKMLFSSFLESCRALQIPLFKKDLKRKRKVLQNIKEVQCIYDQENKNAYPPIEQYVQINYRLKHIGLNLHKKLLNTKSSNCFVIGRVMLLNNIHILHSSVYAIYLGCDKSNNKKKNDKVDFARNSIFFQNSYEDDRSNERFFFLFILPDFMAFEDLPDYIVNETDQNMLASKKKKTTSNSNNNEKKNNNINNNNNNMSNNNSLSNSVSENINLYENYKNVFSKKNNKSDIKIIYHSSFDTDINKKHFVVCSNVCIENISIITNTVIKLPNVNNTAILNNPNNLLLYTFELDRLIEKNIFEPFVLTKMLKSLKCEFYSVLVNQADYLENLKKSKCYNCNLKEKHYELICKKNDCLDDIENIERNINAKSLNLYEDLEGKLNVLQHFGFIDDQNNLTVKGKIASYITLTDEITLTQVIFENILNKLNPAEIAAVLSCFVAPEKKVEESPDLTVNLQEVKAALTNIHSSFEEFYKVIRLRISSEDHWKLCNFKIMFIAYKWTLGVSFAELLEQCELEEGLIVRSILRLDDLCRKVKIAFLYLGNIDLAEKVEKTSHLLRRDIIFTTSLYLQ
ncbi:putative helicase with Zn-finger motif [Plasmodium gaboni]|uniref:Putative helicase with Zn-finger motif n=1 Tax=Plasmodium gaboni TaxID=647221 RepID=A0A151LLW8_9APIC|nr:putative helicase with Zn-finger motif [Plasmodium gaboni]KYO00089.1 putative helicase with Zn-finger motif [Plasmodium gaboni]